VSEPRFANDRGGVDLVEERHGTQGHGGLVFELREQGRSDGVVRRHQGNLSRGWVKEREVLAVSGGVSVVRRERRDSGELFEFLNLVH